MSRFHFSNRSNFYGKKFKFLGQYVYVPSISSQKLSLMILTNPSSLTNETALLFEGTYKKPLIIKLEVPKHEFIINDKEADRSRLPFG
jgi:hypothetical protein